nr:uncharacterized protein LOC122320997 [Drosophila bipectinata]
MTTCSVTSTPARFARCLANFQVDELLLLKKSVQRMELEEEFVDEAGIDYSVMSRSITSTTTTATIMETPLEGKEEMPERLPLMAADR